MIRGLPESCIITLPVYNEVACIRQVCAEWLDLSSNYENFRVLVVDDGSRDDTGAVLREIAASDTRLIVLNQQNGGHGSAIRTAYLSAMRERCEWIFQVDSDGQFAAADFHLLWRERTRSKFILGCRSQRRDSFSRVILSRCHRVLLSLLFGPVPRDPNVPFRLMSAQYLSYLFHFLPSQAFAPNVLLSVLACRAGEDPLNIAVHHKERQTGTASIQGWRTAKIAVRWLWELLRFRFTGFIRAGKSR